MSEPFQRAASKLSIGSYDRADLIVEAQYNPKELQITQPANWADHPSTCHQDADVVVQFGGMKAQTMQIELLFDGYETKGVAGKVTVETLIARLKELACVRDPHSPIEEMRRPHFCLVVWGTKGLPPLLCVIESLTTKYLMFSASGQVLRASCTVAVKEVNIKAMAKEKKKKEEDDEKAQRARSRAARS